MSEFFSDRLYGKDDPVPAKSGKEIEAFIGRDAYAISAKRLADALQEEVLNNVANLSSELYDRGPNELRQFYRALRSICTEKGLSWEGLLEVHEKNLAEGNDDWFKALMILAMIGGNIVVATIMGKALQDGTDPENNDWKVGHIDDSEAADGDGTGGEDIL